jgi:hypothetical protein
MRDFIVIGENIHCSRSAKTTGPRVRENAILHDSGALPVPQAILDGAEWTSGKVRPCAVAAWQGLQGDAAGQAAATAFIRGLRARHSDRVHVTGGFSNVSFGMPQRRLLNEVFVWMALEAGADSGIVDSLLAGPARIAALDPTSEPFRFAHAVLSGQDEYGAEFLAASRDGRLT